MAAQQKRMKTPSILEQQMALSTVQQNILGVTLCKLHMYPLDCNSTNHLQQYGSCQEQVSLLNLHHPADGIANSNCRGLNEQRTCNSHRNESDGGNTIMEEELLEFHAL